MCWIMITVSSIRFLRYLLRFYFIERYWIFLKQAAHMKTLYPGNRSSEGGFKMQDLGEFTGNRVYLEFALPLATAGTWFKSQLHRWCLWPQVTSSLWADVLSNSILGAPRSAERPSFLADSAKSQDWLWLDTFRSCVHLWTNPCGQRRTSGGGLES